MLSFFIDPLGETLFLLEVQFVLHIFPTTFFFIKWDSHFVSLGMFYSESGDKRVDLKITWEAGHFERQTLEERISGEGQKEEPKRSL